jgi:hypothetical protein
VSDYQLLNMDPAPWSLFAFILCSSYRVRDEVLQQYKLINLILQYYYYYYYYYYHHHHHHHHHHYYYYFYYRN